MIDDSMETNDMPKPYFMENKEWYYFDEENFCYKLTDKAPKKAIESYKEFYDNDPIKSNNEWYIIQK
ncbi:hypothetical protein [Megamonas funiformis]|uniref:hypothetical protein n=1 Tax=Megamonas funiformis TaxID=437897 RepID=UPI00356A9FF5